MSPDLALYEPDHEELARIVRAHQAAGRAVVFTNGAFDLLHVGHLRSLWGAKAAGDVLVVAVNSDASVRRIKGAPLPVQPEAERIEVVRSLRPVDLVTIFHDPDARALLDRVRPDVHAKGTDYARETVPERDVVLAYGGRIEIVGDPKTHSTSDLIRRIRELPR